MVVLLVLGSVVLGSVVLVLGSEPLLSSLVPVVLVVLESESSPVVLMAPRSTQMSEAHVRPLRHRPSAVQAQPSEPGEEQEPRPSVSVLQPIARTENRRIENRVVMVCFLVVG